MVSNLTLLMTVMSSVGNSGRLLEDVTLTADKISFHQFSGSDVTFNGGDGLDLYVYLEFDRAYPSLSIGGTSGSCGGKRCWIRKTLSGDTTTMRLSGAAKGMVLPAANVWAECTYGAMLLTESATFDLTAEKGLPGCDMRICYIIGGISNFNDGEIIINGKATTGIAAPGTSQQPTVPCLSKDTCTISNLSPGDMVVQIIEYHSNLKWSVKYSGEAKDCLAGLKMERNTKNPCHPSSIQENLKCSSSSSSSSSSGGGSGGGGTGDGSGINIPSLPKIPWNIIGGVIAGVVVIVIIVVVVYLVACKKKPPVTSETTPETTPETPSSASGAVVVNNNNNNNSSNNMMAMAPQAQPQAPPQYQQAPPQYQQAPPQYYQAPPQYYQAPPQYQQAPPQYQQAPPNP